MIRYETDGVTHQSEQTKSKNFEFFSENRGHFSICLAITTIESSCARAGKNSFFFGKRQFFTERFQKKLNKGGDGFPQDRQGMGAPSSPFGTGDFRKIFEIFSENRGQNIPLPGNNPDRETSRRRVRMDTTFFQKSRKNVDHFQKIRIYGLEVF